jgi:hypothetical protein
MRQEIKSTSKRFNATKVSVGRKSVIIYTEDERIDIPIPDGIPEEMELPPAGTQLRNVMVNTNGGGDMLYGFFPSKGTHIVKFYKFSCRDGEDPKPRTIPGGERKSNDGRKWYQPDRLGFTALLRVMAGEFEGCIIPLTLDYIFERDVDGTCFLKGGKKSVGRVQNFLDLCGFDTANETLRWTDNILPDLQMLLSERSDEATFQVAMKDGWVDEAAELPAGFNFKSAKKAAAGEDDEEEEEVQPRRVRQPVVEDDEPEEDDDRPEVPAKKVVRPAQSKVTVKETDPDEDWSEDEDEAPARPVAKRRAF